MQRESMARWLFRLAGLLATLYPLQANAVVVGAGPIDRLVDEADAIIKGRVVAVDDIRMGFLELTVEITEVLQPGEGRMPSRVKWEVAMPVWPQDLEYPPRPGAVAIFILGRNGDGWAVRNHTHAILPALPGTLPGEGKPRMFAELQRFLRQTPHAQAKARLLMIASYLATAQDESFFSGYLDAEDEWVRRGARVALLRLGPTPARVERARQDIAQYLEGWKRWARELGLPVESWSLTPGPTMPEADQQVLWKVLEQTQDRLFWDLYSDLSWYPRREYLPLYRLICDEAPTALQRNYLVLKSLSRLGEQEDIPRLYRFRNYPDDWARYTVAGALARLLGLDLKAPAVTPYGQPVLPETLAREQRMWEAIEAKMRE